MSNPSENIKILVVDDNLALLSVSTKILEREGYTIFQAQSAKESLSEIEKNKPDIVLLDVVLPDINGNELCKTIKQSNPDIIIVLISSFSIDTKDITNGFENGADGYITRPISDLELIARISSFARLVKINYKKIQAIEKAKQNEEKYKLLADNSADVIFIVDLNLRYSYISPSIERMRGFTQDEIMGTSLSDSLSYDSFKTIKKAVIEEIENEKKPGIDPNRFRVNELEMRCKDGSTIFTETKATILRDKNNKIIGFLGISRDITERKKTESAFKKANEMYRLISEKMSDVVWLMDLQRKSIFVSPSIIQFTGFSAEEYLSQSIPERFTPESAQQGLTVFSQELRMYGEKPDELQNYSKRLELEYICKNGGTKWGELIITPYFNEKNQLIGIHGVTRDITQRKEWENELKDAKQRAELSDNLKTAFLANISHEIRTPMNGILGFAELLKTPDLGTETQEQYIKIIEQSGERMLNIINDIIDISKIEAGQTTLYVQQTSINEILRQLHAFFLPEAQSKNLELHLNSNIKNNDRLIETDHTKLSQIISNLIKNALKFTPTGSITVSCSINNNYLAFSVKDTGIGIPNNLKEAIFERFRQGETALSRAYEGAGLGLSISKAYVKMLGGNIWLNSNLGMGTEFCFTIPYVPVKIENENANNLSNLKKLENLNILIAEDDEASLEYLKTILKNESIHIISASNGLEAYKKVQENKNINLILMDLKMPLMDGFEATKKIKAEYPNIPIIAQTAYAFSDDKNKALHAGCDDYLSKPIKKDLLINIIQKHTSI